MAVGAEAPVERRPVLPLGELRQHPLATSALALMVVLVLVAKVFLDGRFIVNRTPSVPRGIYWLSRGAPSERGRLVAFPIPQHLQTLFRERRLVPSAFFGLLAKPVAAAAGDHVCLRADRLFINGELAASVSRVDSHGRPMPRVTLCRVLEEFEVFVLTTAESFDSRYLGPVTTTDVLGTLTPIIEF